MKEIREKNQTTNTTNYRLILKGRKNSEKKIFFKKSMRMGDVGRIQKTYLSTG